MCWFFGIENKNKIKNNNVKINEKINSHTINKLSSSITIVHWNCNGLSSKVDQLKTYLSLHSPNILTLNEIKCNNNSAIYNLNQIQYNSIYKIREESKGGGIALLINNKIKFEEINLEQFKEEIIGIKICTENNTELNIFTYYNPPQSILSKEIFDFIEKSFENYLICGDLNSKSLSFNCKSENNNGVILEDIIMNNSCQIINAGNFSPTFHTITDKTNYHELLDFFIGSPIFAGKLQEYVIENNDILDSDHSAIKTVYEFDKKLNKTLIKINPKLNFAKTNWTSLFEDLNDTDNNKYNNLKVNDFAKSFTKDINSKINKYTPLSSTSIKHNNFTLPQHILDLIKQKNKHKSELARTGSPLEKKLMYNLKDIINKEIIENKQKEMINFLEKLDKTPVSTKPFWKRINQTRKKNYADSIPTLVKEGKEYNTDEEKANLFADKLKSTFNETDTLDFDMMHRDRINEIINNKLFEDNYENKEVIPITIVELTQAIKKLNNSKSTDTTGFSNFIIKKLPMNSRQGLLNLFNKCLIDNELPSEWKTAEVTMLPKNNKNNKKDINNYRPMAIQVAFKNGSTQVQLHYF